MKNAHPHPIIYMKDIKCSEMKALINFMYKGEVNVSQSSLSEFLKTAEALKIRGLTEGSDGSNGEASTSTTSSTGKEVMSSTSSFKNSHQHQHPHSHSHSHSHLRDVVSSNNVDSSDGILMTSSRKRRRVSMSSNEDSMDPISLAINTNHHQVINKTM